jgi:4-amino-4-deoxy-L-arabinose transferase-like glycosyltransferase
MDVFESLSATAGRMYGSVRSWRTWLAVLFVAAALVRMSCYTGLIGSDDLWYVRYAERIASGEFPHQTNQFAGRSGLTLAEAAVFRVFGVSDGTIVLVPLLAASASVPLVAAIGASLFGPLAGSIAALLLLTSPIHVRFSTILVPEPLMEFWILVGVWCYLAAVRRESRALGAAAGIAVGVAYLTKEPAAFVVPALALAAWSGGRRWLAVTVAAGALAIAGAETVTYAVVLHAPLHRIEGAGVGVPVVRDVNLPPTVTRRDWVTKRLLFVYPRRMLVPTLDFGLHYLAAIIFTALAVLLLRRERTFLLLWAAIPWLFLNFGSPSFTHYRPLWASERYISQTLVPLFLLTAAVFVAPAASRYRRARTFGLFVLAAAAVVGLACSVAVRATGLRTREMAMLRSITATAATKGMVPCHTPHPAGNGHVRVFGDDRMDFWTDALRIFDGRTTSAGDVPPRVRIEADTLGLPRVGPGTCGGSHAAADLEDTEAFPP